MAFNLKNRNFLKLLDFTPKEIMYLLELSESLKKAKYAGTEQQLLKGKKIEGFAPVTSAPERIALTARAAKKTEKRNSCATSL